MEELRNAWAKMCNELYEEKGLTERVDARSYEERGIDKIPMVHEGPNDRQWKQEEFQLHWEV